MSEVTSLPIEESIESDSIDNEIVSDSLEEESKPTQLEVVSSAPSSDGSGSETTSLDVGALNDFFASEEEIRASQISVGQNDYFDFLPDNILTYFEGIMDKYPNTEYYAYHQRHWLQNSQYYSYYDDYFYLFPDLENNPSECYEIIKYNGQANYIVNHTTGTRANATIEYGSAVGQSDFRKGVSTIETKIFLFVAALLLCYVVLHNLFGHFAHH